jgi:hypothetical protein
LDSNQESREENPARSLPSQRAGPARGWI